MEIKKKLLGTDVIYLEHWQEQAKEHRGNYLPGLALDCFQNPKKDRQSHYFARELMWHGYPKSAIKEFERHIAMNAWQAEKAQSIIFMGDCYGMLNQPDKQIQMYSEGFHVDPNRREALIKLARFYKFNNKPLATVAYAKAALEIPWTDYYANDRAMYEQHPHELLYWGYGWIGNIPKAREHLMAAFKYQPYNKEYQRDSKYYFEYPDSGIEGWMTFEECQFLYETAKKMQTICEVGSWQGRSTNALLTGCKGQVTAVDTFKGSEEERDWSHNPTKDILAEFKKNVGHFKNLTTIVGKSVEVDKTMPDDSFDMVFIDAGHRYEDVVADIRAWKSKAKVMLCGHDYVKGLDEVMRAVDDELGWPDEIHGSIWVKWLNKPSDFNTKTLMNAHHKFYYKGVKCTKYAFDYLNYQMIINEVEPDLIIEVGTDEGGGSLYMADLLNYGMVHTIDINDKAKDALENHPKIKYFTNGWENYDLKNTEGFKKIMVIEDSSHTYENTLAVMKKFAPVVSPDSYLIVEDGIVTELGNDRLFDGGPLRATREFMQDNKDFVVDRKWCDFFGHNATANPDGYLKKLNKKLSVVMPVRNKLEMTEQTIKSLRANTPTLGEIILIDDGSIEDFTKLEGIRYYKNKGTGVNVAWNYGASLAKYPYIAFLNNDLLFSPKWVEPLYEALNDDVWVVSPYHTAYAIPDDFPAGKGRKNNLEGVGVGIPFLGSAFMITKENWSKIGPIDERLKIWCGDNYIYETVKDAGKQCKEVPEAYVHHLINQTINDYKGVNEILNKDMETFNIIIKEKGWLK